MKYGEITKGQHADDKRMCSAILLVSLITFPKAEVILDCVVASQGIRQIFLTS